MERCHCRNWRVRTRSDDGVRKHVPMLLNDADRRTTVIRAARRGGRKSFFFFFLARPRRNQIYEESRAALRPDEYPLSEGISDQRAVPVLSRPRTVSCVWLRTSKDASSIAYFAAKAQINGPIVGLMGAGTWREPIRDSFEIRSPETIASTKHLRRGLCSLLQSCTSFAFSASYHQELDLLNLDLVFGTLQFTMGCCQQHPPAVEFQKLARQGLSYMFCWTGNDQTVRLQKRNGQNASKRISRASNLGSIDSKRRVILDRQQC